MRRLIFLLTVFALAGAFVGAAFAGSQSNGNNGGGNNGNDGGTTVCDNGANVQVNGSDNAVQQYLDHHPGATIGACDTGGGDNNGGGNNGGGDTGGGGTGGGGNNGGGDNGGGDNGAGVTTAGSPRSANGIFLCYSTFQGEPGVWLESQAKALFAQGYWLPYAVAGNVAGGTNIGKFHLVCNLAGTQSVHDSFAGQDGTVFGHDYAGVFGLYPMLGV